MFFFSVSFIYFILFLFYSLLLSDTKYCFIIIIVCYLRNTPQRERKEVGTVRKGPNDAGHVVWALSFRVYIYIYIYITLIDILLTT